MTAFSPSARSGNAELRLLRVHSFATVLDSYHDLGTTEYHTDVV